MSRVVVRLSDEDQWKIREFAAGRSMMSRRAGIVSQKVDPTRGDEDIDLDGMRGEWAVAKFFGEIPKMDVRPDDGWDLYIAGMRADVKTTRHQTGKLLLRDIDRIAADILILAILEDDSHVRLAGWATGEQFRLMAKPFQAHGRGGYAMEQVELRPVGELLEKLQLARVNR